LILSPHKLCREDTDAVRKIPEDRFLLIVDSTNAILSAAEQLGQQIRGDDEDRDIYNFLPGLMAIPQELEDGFKTLATKLYPDLSTISLHLGIDTAVYHFNKLTKTPDRQQQSEIRYLVAIINIMKAAWILRIVRTSHDYQIVANYAPLDAFEEQMDRWGLTVQRFFDKFENVISHLPNKTMESRTWSYIL